MPHKKKEIPEDIQKLLKEVCDHFDKEDRATRERQIRTWRRLKLMWDGFQRVWYSEVAHDWRVWDDQINADSSNQSYYDKPINIFRAYLESIIAALSITIPPIKCYPDDADNPLDLATAKAGDKIGELIYRHNDVVLLWLHALFVFCTEGMIACYSYPREDEKYGTYEKDEYEEITEEQRLCPNCNEQLADELFSNRELDEFMPGDDDVEIKNIIKNQGPICPECGSMLDPELQKSPLIVTRLIGKTTHPKSRICTEVYGGLYVKVPNYAMKQEDTPYLIFSYETHYANAIERYGHLRSKLNTKIGPGSGGLYDPYERWARLNPQYNGEYPMDTVTVRNNWLRCAAFNVLKIKEIISRWS
jgi:ribosomal protein S27AE